MKLTLNSLGRKVPLELPGVGTFRPYETPEVEIGRASCRERV